MDTYLLLPTRYEPPARPVRKHTLNTIMEDERSEDEHSSCGSIGQIRDRVRESSLAYAPSLGSVSPVSSLTSSPSSYFPDNRQSRPDFDDLDDISDEEPVEDLVIKPGRAADKTNAHFACPRTAVELKVTRNRYPSITIPPPSHWSTTQRLQKISPMISPARPPKIPLSPAVLSMLNRDLPTSSQTPSLDESSISDPQASSTAPTTPEMRTPFEGAESWSSEEIKQKLFRSDLANLFESLKSPDLNVSRDDDGDLWEDMSGFDNGHGTIVRDFGSDHGQSRQDSPVLGVDGEGSEAGVQLPPKALDTLRQLSVDIPVSTDLASDTRSIGEMEEVPCASFRRRSLDVTPISQHSEYSLDQLSIPSPGGFFSSLSSNYRHTWCPARSRPLSLMAPSSTVAEQFYKCPWKTDPPVIVDQVVQVDDNDSNGPPTARQFPLTSQAEEFPQDDGPVLSDLGPAQSAGEYDPDYEQEIQHIAENSFDRTSGWLAAQSAYMAALRETNPVNDLTLDTTTISRTRSLHFRNDSLESPIKKVVRFLEREDERRRKSGANDTGQGDSIYYHAFQHINNDESSYDAFRHGQTRSDSIQAGRVCLPHEHIDRLQGAFKISTVDRPAPLRPISMLPGKQKKECEQTVEQKVISRVERERQALQQLNTSMWVIEASRFLKHGKLLNSPAAKKLAHKSRDKESTEQMRVLDLGGLPNCDWAWHCAREYPNAKVHTATTESYPIDFHIRGPENHRCIEVSKLWALPYADDYFDAVSARSLFSHLKTEKPLGHTMDEYDLCLQECLRCLKPGGYLEFFVLDSEILSSGPRGTALSVEFSFSLKTRGYDPAPTKNWLGRLRRAGFDDIKRAWTFLPMGAPCKEPPLLPETPPPDVPTFDPNSAEAVQGPVGSTADAAGVAGLVGSWAWEQWMLKLQMEMGKEELLQGVGAVLEEGKFTGAGWRCLSGWARKPIIR